MALTKGLDILISAGTGGSKQASGGHKGCTLTM